MRHDYKGGHMEHKPIYPKSRDNRVKLLHFSFILPLGFGSHQSYSKVIHKNIYIPFILNIFLVFYTIIKK